MGRKKQAKLLLWLKVLAICGSAVFMIKGVGKVYADAWNDVGNDEEIRKIQITEPETIRMPDIEINAITEKQLSEEISECQSNMPGLDWDAEDAYFLEKIAMAEAEGEGIEGKALVMRVVLNRVLSDKFPDTIEEVIYQRTDSGGWQFSPMQERGRWYTTEPDQECREALELVLAEKWDESQGALYFESAGKSDWHRKNLKFLFQNGNHYFYTDKELTE